MKKKLIIITLAILLSISIVFIKLNFSQYLPNKNYGITGLLKLEEVNNLFIVSSMFKQGLDPKQINEDDYILAYSGNEPINILRQLQYLTSQDIKINNLYIDMYAWTIVRAPWIDDLNILWDSDFVTIKNIYDDLKNNSSISYFIEFFISSNNEFLLTYPLSSFLMNRFYLRGGNNYLASSSSKNYLDQLKFENIYTNDDLNDKQIQAIKEIKQICDKEGINLCFIETPKYIREMHYDRYLVVMKDYQELLDELNINYLLADYFEIDYSNSDYFFDLVHMSSNGAKEYTIQLIKYLKDAYN